MRVACVFRYVLVSGAHFHTCRVHSVRVDTANNKLKAIAPVIRHHGVEYERSHFKKLIDTGKLDASLPDATKWLTVAFDDIVVPGQRGISLDLMLQSNGPEFERFLAAAIVEYMLVHPEWVTNSYSSGGTASDNQPLVIQTVHDLKTPETLRLDVNLLKGLKSHFHADVLSAVTLAVVTNCLRVLPESTVKQDILARIWGHVQKHAIKPHWEVKGKRQEAFHCFNEHSRKCVASAVGKVVELVREIVPLQIADDIAKNLEASVTMDSPAYNLMVSFAMFAHWVPVNLTSWNCCAFRFEL